MKLTELKTLLLNGHAPENLLVFQCKDNFFLANQYLNKILDITGKELNVIHSIYQVLNPSLSLVFDFTEKLNVLYVDTFMEASEEYENLQSTIIICKTIDKKLVEVLEPYTVDFMAPTEANIKAYMQERCPALLGSDIDWLYTATGGNIYRIENELDKLVLFEKTKQKEILNGLRFDKASDLYTTTTFDLSNNLANNNRMAIIEFLRHEYVYDFDPIALTNLLLTKFRNILLVTHNSRVDLNKAGISAAQAGAIRKYESGLSQEYLFKVIKFLSRVDQDLKLGRYDMPKQQLLDYVILNIVR